MAGLLYFAAVLPTLRGLVRRWGDRTQNPRFQDLLWRLLPDSSQNSRLPGGNTNGDSRSMPVSSGQIGWLTDKTEAVVTIAVSSGPSRGSGPTVAVHRCCTASLAPKAVPAGPVPFVTCWLLGVRVRSSGRLSAVVAVSSSISRPPRRKKDLQRPAQEHCARVRLGTHIPAGGRQRQALSASLSTFYAALKLARSDCSR